ncbi:MAG: hypothetical protein PHF58_10570 [Methylotenera sp.]|nr:hypothetical protein [Methylotenera sp.]
MATWPANLPAPAITGYGIEAVDGVLHTQMDAGPTRSRQQFTAVPNKLTVKWSFSLGEMALFEAWWRYETLNGSAWFNVNLANGIGISTMEAKFAKPPKKGALTGLRWDVQAELEVRTMPVLPPTYYQLALIYPPNDLSYAAFMLGQLVNVVLPEGFA